MLGAGTSRHSSHLDASCSGGATHASTHVRAPLLRRPSRRATILALLQQPQQEQQQQEHHHHHSHQPQHRRQRRRSALLAGCALATAAWQPGGLPAVAREHIARSPRLYAGVSATPPPMVDSRGGRQGALEAEDALQRLRAAEAAVDAGRIEQALEGYTYIVDRYPDLALADYARLGRGLCLYEVGRVSDALLTLEDEEAVLRGAAQVHAALAGILYVERPRLVIRAEEEWSLATEFDSRYSDLEWVRRSKHWPPRAVEALTRFLKLQR